MAINLLDIVPNKVSRDLSGYITYIYGPGGAGKTTFGASCKKPLLLAFELGYKALPGVMAQPVQTWGEVKQVLRDLKRPEVKEVFSTIVLLLNRILTTILLGWSPWCSPRLHLTLDFYVLVTHFLVTMVTLLPKHTIVFSLAITLSIKVIAVWILLVVVSLFLDM